MSFFDTTLEMMWLLPCQVPREGWTAHATMQEPESHGGIKKDLASFSQTPDPYLRMELARLLRRSAFCALASATRLARIWAYSFCWEMVSFGENDKEF
jgi:hypothetical protein